MYVYVCTCMCACVLTTGMTVGYRQTINNRKSIRSATQADERMPEFLDEGDMWPLEACCFVISPQRLWEIHFIHRASKQGIVFILLSVWLTLLKTSGPDEWHVAGSWQLEMHLWGVNNNQQSLRLENHTANGTQSSKRVALELSSCTSPDERASSLFLPQQAVFVLPGIWVFIFEGTSVFTG